MSIFDDNLAIVASGRSLLHSCYGEAIDQFPKALRFNSATIKNHEEDVGRFWTHWCCNFTCATYGGIKGHPIHEVVCCDRPFGPAVRFNFKRLPCESVLYIPPVILEELENRYTEKYFIPSSGLRLLWWIYKETGKKISKTRIFGFDCFGSKARRDDYVGKPDPRSRKYYNQGQPSPKHLPGMERMIINEITA